MERNTNYLQSQYTQKSLKENNKLVLSMKNKHENHWVHGLLQVSQMFHIQVQLSWPMISCWHHTEITVSHELESRQNSALADLTFNMQDVGKKIHFFTNQIKRLHQFLSHEVSELCPVWFKVHYFFCVSPTYGFDSPLLSWRVCHSHTFPLQSAIWNSTQNGFWKWMLNPSSSSNPEPGH